MSEGQKSSPVLEVRALSKSFPGVKANDRVSFDIRRGEVHCLLGENGAGKTTLAECLYGSYRPDAGGIVFKGRKVNISSPREAIKLGIGMVHQHFDLVPPMSVLENIVVGTASQGAILDLGSAAEKVTALCDAYQVDLDLYARVDDLAVGQQQWIEILKALYEGVEFLILDEPTAVLTPQEIEKLFAILGKMKTQGFSIILITHKLNEVMEISDRVTVLRRGQLQATVNTSEVSKEELARLMVGRDVVFRVEKDIQEAGAAVLEMRHVVVGVGRERKVLRGIDLTVRRAEVVGLAGVAGNGQQELFDALVGVRKVDGGAIVLDGQDVTHLTPSRRMAAGLASIPEDRVREGLLMDHPIHENLILGKHRERAFRTAGLLAGSKIRSFAERKIAEFDIAALSPGQRANNLSGGNLQKVILARELAGEPKFLLANQPTRGLDVAAIEYVHGRLLDLRAKGAGVLLISDDLDEIFDLSDRIAVIYKGELMALRPAGEAGMEEIGLLMAGVRKGDAG